MVDAAFARMLEINRRYDKIEITANFLFGDDLPSGHLTSFIELTQKRLRRPYGKGAIYFSPLVDGGMEKNQPASTAGRAADAFPSNAWS